MALTVLNVAYPFAPVRGDAVGGAEQIVGALDEALTRRGHRSLVLACAGSETAGELFPLQIPGGEIDERVRGRVCSETARRLEDIRLRERPDIIHLHGIDFSQYLPRAGRTLATLHLPLDWYDAAALRPSRGDIWLHGVSRSQQAQAPEGVCLRPPISNGVDVQALRPGAPEGGYALWLGRVCPEKAPHLAMQAAARAGVPVRLAGRTFAYEAHRRYWDEEVAPRLGPEAIWLGALGGEAKRAALAGAVCVLIPSQAEETSSLVAMEALACGSPVVAFRRGALPEIVSHGRTGFLVDDVDTMAEAILACKALSRPECRREAERRFSLSTMMDGYFTLYAEMVSAL